MASRTAIWRGVFAIIIAMAGIFVFCFVTDFETTSLAFLISLLVMPSVVLYLLLNKTGSRRLLGVSGFLLPAVFIVGGCLYRIRELRIPFALDGLSDGGLDMLVFCLQCHAVGLGCALVALLLGDTRQMHSPSGSRCNAIVSTQRRVVASSMDDAGAWFVLIVVTGFSVWSQALLPICGPRGCGGFAAHVITLWCGMAAGAMVLIEIGWTEYRRLARKIEPTWTRIVTIAMSVVLLISAMTTMRH